MTDRTRKVTMMLFIIMLIIMVYMTVKLYAIKNMYIELEKKYEYYIEEEKNGHKAYS